MNLLSKRQKAVIAQLARKAWDALDVRVRTKLTEAAGSDNKAFTTWRHDQQELVVGIESLTQALSERDYLRLRAHFENHSGESGRALNSLLRHADEANLRELYLLEQACCEAGFDFPAYPGAICRRQFRCALEAASQGQLRKLLFTVRNRGQAKARRERQAELAF